jgi:hypothetical protein
MGEGLPLCKEEEACSAWIGENNVPEWLKLTIPGVFGLMTALLAAGLSARWAVRRVYREKWWERKEKAYAEIIDALYDIVRYCELTADEYLQGNDYSDNPKKKEFGQSYTKAYWKIQKATDIGAFVISEQAAGILKILRDRPRLKWEENPPWEVYEQDAKHYRESIAEIRQCARKELGG